MLKERIAKELRGVNGRIGVAIEVEGESFSFLQDDVFPSASVIKIPILIEGLKQSEIGKINLHELTSISSKTGGSGVIQALSFNAKLTIKDLLTLMIIVSDNTATNILIDLLDMDAINESMKMMGLKNTVLKRKMMDFKAKAKGFDNVTSPGDMLTCLKVINEGDYLSVSSRQNAIDIMSCQQLLDKLPAMFDTDTLFVANKTGSLPHVEHDCAVFKYKGKTAYAVVLTDELEDTFAGKQVISRIGKHIYDYLMEKR